MKICILARFYYPYKTGGAEIFSNIIANMLGEKGHEVHVITQNTGKRVRHSIRSSQERMVHIHKIGFSPYLKPPFYTFGCVLYFYRVIKILKKIQPDIIHAIQTNFNGTYGVFLSRLLKIKVIINDHGMFYKLPFWHKKVFSRISLAKADRIIVPSKIMKEDIVKYYRDFKQKIVVIHNGIFFDNFKKHDCQSAKKRLGWDKDVFMITFIGRLSSVKRPLFAVKTFEYLTNNQLKGKKRGNRKNQKLRLNLIGGGPERTSLEDYIKKNSLSRNVFLFGEKKKDEIPLYSCASDIVFMPSRIECFPIVLLEALAGSCPVVASKVGGIPEIIEEGKNGFLFSPDDMKGFAGGIQKLIEDKLLFEIMQKKNFEKAYKFRWGEKVEEFEELYKDVLDNK